MASPLLINILPSIINRVRLKMSSENMKGAKAKRSEARKPLLKPRTEGRNQNMKIQKEGIKT